MLKTVVAAAVVASFVLAVGAMPSETRATDASVKISGRVLRDTAGGRNRADRRLPARPGRPEPRVRHARPERARLVRLPDAEGARRADPGSAARLAQEPSRAVPLLLGCEHDRQPRRPRAREQARRAAGRAADRVRARVRRAAGRAAAAADAARALEAAPAARARTAAVEWGVNDVHAPALWALGFTGQGMVVASADTGVRWTHAALKTPLPRLERQRGRPQLQLARRDPLGRRRLRRRHRPALRRQRARHAHHRHGRRRRRRRQPDRRRARREVDRLPQHGSGQRAARPRTPSASSSSSRRPTSAAATPIRRSARMS